MPKPENPALLGVAVIEFQPIKSRKITTADFCEALLVDLGCSVGGWGGDDGVAFTNKWEFFDPEKVEDVMDLWPWPHWQMVYLGHHRPDMGDCRSLRYRYIHAPEPIRVQYPRTPKCGMFVVGNPDVALEDIKANDLVWFDDWISWATEPAMLAARESGRD